MTFEEVKKFLEENKEDEKVKELFQGSELSLEGVQEFLNKDEDAKKWLEAEKDRHLNKGLETFKQKSLPKLVDEEVSKRNPQKTPEQIELEKIKQQLADMEGQKTKESLRNVALKEATEKGIPHDVVDYLLGEDEDSTTNNLSKFEESMKKYVDSKVSERVKDSSYTPPAGDDKNTKTFTLEEIKGMSDTEINENWDAVQDTLSQNK